ncbi:MAG: DUF554 domain-containing protein [Clostridia bacterium]|nr:DUF554 domain-containing protein [Clostridia bacterium]
MREILMSYSGVLVNTVTVIIGSCVGLLLKKQLPEKLTNAVMCAIGLCTLAIGVMGVIKGENQLVMIISLVLGTIVGTLTDIDGKLTKLGDKLQNRRKNKKGEAGDTATFSQGFVTASLLFCVGAMTIVGSMNAGISGDNQMLYTKSVLDLISSSMLAASLGIGVMCASVFVFVFQGALVALSMLLGSFLSDFAVAELVCAGSVMIVALGLNLLKITKIKVANLLPGLIFVPFVCMVFELF